MELSVFELSKHLGVATNTIERWVRQGNLPVSKKGRNFRFRSSDLEKWAIKHNIKLSLLNKEKPKKEVQPVLSLSEAVQSGGVYYDIPGNDVESVLEAAIAEIVKIPEDFKIDLLERLIERENALSTGIGNGFAIPHPREQLSYLENPIVCICFLKHPVDYNALDNKPVSTLFFILCPELKMHLHLLSSLSFCLKDNEFTAFLESKPDLDQLIEKIDALHKTDPV